MNEERPPIKLGHLLVYIAGRLEAIEESQRKLQNSHDRASIERRVGLVHLLVEFLRWSGTVTSQISTIFIAGYVAIEHNWYVTKIVTWFSSILGLK